MVDGEATRASDIAKDSVGVIDVIRGQALVASLIFRSQGGGYSVFKSFLRSYGPYNTLFFLLLRFLAQKLGREIHSLKQ